MSNSLSLLRLNVGFIIHQTIGFSRDFNFNLQEVLLPPDLRLNDLSGTCRITRTPQGLLMQSKAHAMLEAECVRCLDTFLQHLDIDFTELYAFSDRTASDLGLILPEDGKIDLVPLLREYMTLEIPISPLCRPDCKGLCPICGENMNYTTCNHDPDTIDPRLVVLKTLQQKNH